MRRVGDAFVAHDAVVAGDIVLSHGVNIWYGCVLRGDLARITLETDVNLQDGTIVHTDHDEPLVVEAGVVVGHRAILHGARIGRGSLVGMGAILLAGCEIGEECVIGAGALIGERKKIPPRSLVVGMPGKVVRAVTDEDVASIRRACAGYREMAARHAAGEFPPPWDGEGRG
ncbi:MAG: gamma carbonic anhydrase family protein [Gemmataceae bacterium]|nr:gamma carbonic anhydrase family protein [Gemmataceae bacterium]